MSESKIDKFKDAKIINCIDLEVLVKQVTNQNYSFCYQNELCPSKYPGEPDFHFMVPVSSINNDSYNRFSRGEGEKITDGYSSDKMTLGLQDISVQDLLDGVCAANQINPGLYLILY